MKRFLPYVFLVLVIVAPVSVSSVAAAPVPVTTFTLIQGLPEAMNVGDMATVVVQVESDQEFISVQALPSFMFPGKGVVAVHGGDHAGRGTSAMLEVTFQAKGSTANFPNGGFAPVHVVVGIRYGGGYVAVQDYLFNVTVP